MKRIFTLVIITLLLVFYGKAEAQTRPQVVVTWKTNSNVPPSYVGKAMASPGSTLKASVIILDSGKVADVSGNEIKWFIDGDFYKGGVGMKSLEVLVPQNSPSPLKIKAQVSNYKDLLLGKTIEIPVVRPEAVITTASPPGILRGNSASLRAQAFFFNSDSFNYEWRVGDKDPISGKDDVLSLDLSSLKDNFNLRLGLTIRNGLESASLTKNFIYKK